MESNSDKQLRSKLTGVEFPFDPQAWEQMEAMLDKKKKRRGFFWWWAGGIAAVLLVGIIGFEVGKKYETRNTKHEANATEQTAVTNNESQIANEGTNSLSQIATSGKNENRNQKLQAINNKQQTTVAQTTGEAVHASGISGRESNGTTTSIYSNPNNPSNLPARLSRSGGRSNVFSEMKKHKQQQSAQAKDGSANTAVSASPKNPFKEEADMLASAGVQNSIAERIEMDKRFALLETTEEEYSFDKKSEDALPKMKKKIFNYSLGAVANVTGTMVSDFGFRKFYSRPSFAAGLAHEFLFINRIAITNGFLYSQTGFEVKEPTAPVDSASTTMSYSSAIRELQIPIGIKAYPVDKKWFRFSIATGIINHIKLTEAFAVEKTDNNISNILFIPNSFVATADNPFIEGLNKSSVFTDEDRSQAQLGEYYGMGGLRRYYASFYASAGIEFIAKKHFVFFTEPMFYMSLNKIGLQDKRKYNVGVNGGFRYQF